jgi:DNA-directed RNA polymerase specialized sigma24 family protein
MPRQSPYLIRLSREERRILDARSRQYTLPYRDVVRAKIILLAAEGLENQEIGERLDTPRPIVSKWRQRFFRERLAGLEERPRGGRPSAFSPSRRGTSQGAGL